MRGNGHDRAGAVACENVVGDEDRELVAVHRVDTRDAFELHARLLLVELRALEVALRGRLLLVGLHLVGVLERAVLEPFRDERVLWRKHHVRRAEKRVAAGGVDGYLFVGASAACQDTKVNQRAGGLADPVALHLLDALGPVERVEIPEKPLGVLGDLEHPLAHGLPDDRMVAALGPAVDHFFVRKYRAKRGAPIDRHLCDIGKPLLVELLEDPLRPAVVLGIGRVDLAVPVVAEAERANLLAETVDVLLRRYRGMGACLDGVLLGGKAERVPAHRMKDVEPLHPLVAAEDVRRGISLGMADVQPCARRIREHVEAVEFLARSG